MVLFTLVLVAGYVCGCWKNGAVGSESNLIRPSSIVDRPSSGALDDPLLPVADHYDPDLPVLTTSVDKLVQWARRSSIWPGSRSASPAARSR